MGSPFSYRESHLAPIRMPLPLQANDKADGEELRTSAWLGFAARFGLGIDVLLLRRYVARQPGDTISGRSGSC